MNVKRKMFNLNMVKMIGSHCYTYSIVHCVAGRSRFTHFEVFVVRFTSI